MTFKNKTVFCKFQPLTTVRRLVVMLHPLLSLLYFITDNLMTGIMENQLILFLWNFIVSRVSGDKSNCFL